MHHPHIRSLFPWGTAIELVTRRVILVAHAFAVGERDLPGELEQVVGDTTYAPVEVFAHAARCIVGVVVAAGVAITKALGVVCPVAYREEAVAFGVAVGEGIDLF